MGEIEVIHWSTGRIRYGDLQPGDRIVERGAELRVDAVAICDADGLGTLADITRGGVSETYYASDETDVRVPVRPWPGYTLARGDGPGECHCLYRRTEDHGWARLHFDPACPKRCEDQRKTVVHATFRLGGA